MNKQLITALALATSVFVSGCAMLEPRVPRTDPSIPAEWSLPPVTSAGADAHPPEAGPEGLQVADIGWRDFFADPRLEELIGQALDNNRDLRIAILNVERARAQYRIQRADRLPSLGANATLERTGGDAPVQDLYTAGVGLAAFELDLFGRVRNLSQAALQQFLATEESRRAAQLTLIAEVANAWLTLAADRELLEIAEQTLRNYEEWFRLTEQRHELGAVSGLELNQARTLVETARADVARYAGQVARDENALNLLVGQPVDPALLPERFLPQVSGLGPLPAGVPAEVLLRRPDVMAAEHRLLSANANIGAARAAFFPSISLTGMVGSASTELSDLFEGGTGFWSFSPQINLPIFQGGRLRAALGVAQADRDIALADYERAIQAGFREVADALALSSTLARQRDALEDLVEASGNTLELSQARYDAGLVSYLELLDAQRTHYQAEQSLVQVQLAEQANRVTLYRVLGGGWIERAP